MPSLKMKLENEYGYKVTVTNPRTVGKDHFLYFRRTERPYENILYNDLLSSSQVRKA